MSQFIQYYPDAAPLIGDLYAKAMDWPGAEEVSKRLEFILPPEIKLEMETKEILRAGGTPPPPPEPPPPPPEEMMKLQQGELKLQEGQLKLQLGEMKLQELQIGLQEAQVGLQEAQVKLEQENAKLAGMVQEIKFKTIEFLEGGEKEKEDGK